MADSNATQSEIGVAGLDVIGRNVALHLADRHFNVAAYDWDRQKTAALRKEITGPEPRVADSVSEWLASLRRPREILVFSGPEATMEVILERLLPHLEPEDLVMDAGDSYFKDTAMLDRRLAQQSIPFMGIGFAGGETGARHGGIVMSGGGQPARERTSPLLEVMADRIRGQACVCGLKTAAAAHFVKMVHAGVEYAILALLSETFDVLQRTLLVSEEEMQDPSGAWRIGVLNGYLMEITGQVFEVMDKQSPRELLQGKLEAARTGAMGKWVVQSAWELGVPIPTIEAAVETQRVDAVEQMGALLASPFRQPAERSGKDPHNVVDELHSALHAAMMIAYAQGIALLSAASRHHGFEFRLHEITRAWRGCTHLRTTMLDDITHALQATPDLPDLLSDDDLSESVMGCQENLRQAVWRAHNLDTVVPALMASLDYLDADRAAWMPVNLIQVRFGQPGRASALVDEAG